jgi:hypothetical protein
MWWNSSWDWRSAEVDAGGRAKVDEGIWNCFLAESEM